MFTRRLLVIDALLLIAVLGGNWMGRVERARPIRPDFLQPLRLPFRGWKTSDRRLTPAEVRLLQPDAALKRDYRSRNGDEFQLAVIAGSRKRSVHTPAYCLPGGGWDTLSQRTRVIRLPTGPVTAIQALMNDGNGHALVVTYLFTDGVDSTENLFRFQGMQLLKRLRGEATIGALVRIVAPVRTDPAAAERLTDAFAQGVLPPVLDAVRNARRGE